MEPTQFSPVPVVDKENGIIDPVTLSPQDMASFLAELITSFNNRIIKEKNIEIEWDKLI